MCVCMCTWCGGALALPPQLVAGVCESDGRVDGPAAQAKFSDPCGLSADVDGTLYVADTGNNCIRRVSPDGTVSTFSGFASSGGLRDGPSEVAQFLELCDVQVTRGRGGGGGPRPRKAHGWLACVPRPIDCVAAPGWWWTGGSAAGACV